MGDYEHESPPQALGHDIAPKPVWLEQAVETLAKALYDSSALAPRPRYPNDWDYTPQILREPFLTKARAVLDAIMAIGRKECVELVDERFSLILKAYNAAAPDEHVLRFGLAARQDEAKTLRAAICAKGVVT